MWITLYLSTCPNQVIIHPLGQVDINAWRFTQERFSPKLPELKLKTIQDRYLLVRTSEILEIVVLWASTIFHSCKATICLICLPNLVIILYENVALCFVESIVSFCSICKSRAVSNDQRGNCEVRTEVDPDFKPASSTFLLRFCSL